MDGNNKVWEGNAQVPFVDKDIGHNCSKGELSSVTSLVKVMRLTRMESII